jgi:hypothetical protein
VGLPAGKYSLTITPDISVKTCIKEVIIQDYCGNRSNKKIAPISFVETQRKLLQTPPF